MDVVSQHSPMKERITLLELFIVCLKIGLVTFGGGYSMLPYFYSEILTKRRWFEEEEFVDILTVAQTIPGAIAVNASFNIGISKRGILGGIVAVSGMVLPAFVAVIMIMLFLVNFRDEILVRKVIVGIITASAALICMSAVRLSAKVFEKSRLGNILIASCVFIAIGYFNMDIVWLIIFGVAIGLIRYFINYAGTKCPDGEQ